MSEIIKKKIVRITFRVLWQGMFDHTEEDIEDISDTAQETIIAAVLKLIKKEKDIGRHTVGFRYQIIEKIKASVKNEDFKKEKLVGEESPIFWFGGSFTKNPQKQTCFVTRFGAWSVCDENDVILPDPDTK
jgi:hypothetical protein